MSVKAKVPRAAVVPPMTPAVLRLSPVGRAPAETDHVYGASPPDAVTVLVYALVYVPDGKVIADTATAARIWMVID